jgi:NAD(P)-dependent dehydrogenase (short-subunit alcohol dehydrogenase family)
LNTIIDNRLDAMNYDFDGEKVLVTGGSRGIGYGIAKAFALANAEVFILSSSEDVVAAAARLGDESNSVVRGYQCDVTDGDRVRATMLEIGPLEILVANAGLERITPITDKSSEVEATFRRIIDINVIGTYLVTREVVNQMSTGGRVIITSSVWGKSAIGEFSAYIASKHANIGFMRSLARELGPGGIRVNCVCPGWVKTDAAILSLKRMSQQEERPEAEILAKIMATQCLDGLQEPDDVAGAYLFLASPLAKNITGQALNVDRGEFLG